MLYYICNRNDEPVQINKASKENKMKTVFKFHGYWAGDLKKQFKSNGSFCAEVIYRYAVAENEEEAIEKMEQYKKDLIAQGCDELVFDYNPSIEISQVIA